MTKKDKAFIEKFETVSHQLMATFLENEGYVTAGMDHNDMIDIIFNGEHDTSVKFSISVMSGLTRAILENETVGYN